MDYLIGFILGGLAIGILWALRERERREWSEDMAEAIEKGREENLRLRAREERNYEAFAHMQGGLRQMWVGLGGNGKLPGSAEQEPQDCPQRVTAKLPVPSLNGGPICKGRWQ